jgi:phosphoglycolate phosphatase
MKINKLKTLIFDLDGTLIDSSASILAGFSAALAEHKISPKQALTAAIIGPPLRETLSILSGSAAPELLDSLTNAFKAHYDTEGYKATTVFAGIEPMLKQAHLAGITLHIATNKRLLPTQLILEHLGWRDLFASVYALDKYTPPFPSKAAMLTGLLKEQNIHIATAAYVGDRPEDGYAADANALAFYAAEWGYSAFPPEETAKHWIKASAPCELPCN